MNMFSDTLTKHSLLQHPFYLAWNAGTLTRAQLALYAEQYGDFIRLVSQGWQKLGEDQIASEEKEHYELWKDFSASLGGTLPAASLPAVRQLVTSTQKLYSNYASALGALYAFEAQQPATASSKLQGLRDHYSHWSADQKYFEVHANDTQEPALLEEKLKGLDKDSLDEAHAACQSTCQALWDALTSIMEAQKN